MPRLIAALTINWSNSTALIHGLDVFWAYHSAILSFAIFGVKHIILQIIKSCGTFCRIDNEKVSNLILMINVYNNNVTICSIYVLRGNALT